MWNIIHKMIPHEGSNMQFGGDNLFNSFYRNFMLIRPYFYKKHLNFKIFSTLNSIQTFNFEIADQAVKLLPSF